jgi:hypothetical protein
MDIFLRNFEYNNIIICKKKLENKKRNLPKKSQVESMWKNYW